MLIKVNIPGKDHDPTAYLNVRITALTNYLVDEVPGMDWVVMRIRNTDNVQGKVFGISLPRHDQSKPDVVWDVLRNVDQSNDMFGLTDGL
jgi:hypothetical protein